MVIQQTYEQEATPEIGAIEQSLDNQQQIVEDKDLIPLAWEIAEALTSPDKLIRRGAIDRFESIKSFYNSPLICYLLATRIVDPDIEIRSRVIKIVGELVNVPVLDAESNSVNKHLINYLSQMRTRHIYAIIQVYNFQLELVKNIEEILKVCPYAGRHLMEIVFSKGSPMEIRKAAVTLIGVIGYVDIVADLEKYKLRLVAKLTQGHQESGSYTNTTGETRLLPDLEQTINKLNSM